MIKQCLVCLSDFKVKPSHADKTFCCSLACANERRKTTLSGANNPNYRGGSIKICETCHKEYIGYGERRRTCSTVCSANAKRGVTRIDKKPVKLRQRDFLSQCGFRWCDCAKCGKQFQFHNSNKKFCPKCSPAGIYYKRCPTCKIEYSTIQHRQIYCGKKCYNKSMIERQKGDKSHRWKGGTTAPDRLFRNSTEYAEWRNAVFARDDYVCQMCFERGGKLAAHHIREFALHHDLRTHLGNGITLCWPCHHSIKKKERMYETTFYDITGGI